MARPLRLLNASITGSSVSLDRGSNASFDSINVVENVGFDDQTPENAYDKLQRNERVNFAAETRQNDIYDDVGPKSWSQPNSKMSSKTPSRGNHRSGIGRAIRYLLIFLIIFVAIVAMLLSIMLMLGKLGPKCACKKSGSSQSPIIGEVNQRKDLNTSDPNVPQSTFNLDMSPFYDILDDLKANVTSLRKQAESVMTESETNKGALVTIWTEFSIIEAAINKFSNRLDSAIDHVNQTVHALNPDHSSVFTQIRTLNSTLNNELTKIKQTSEQKNHAINSETNSMNSSLAEKAASKLSSPGPVGDQGSNGFKGPPGIKGSTGSQGAKGDVGSKGQRGDIGSPGDKGSKGSVGSKGSPGAQGSNGLTGQVGNKGSKGNRGEPGLQGIGNFSWCKVKKDSAALTDINQGNDEAAVTDTESLKVISATCSTDTGQEYNLQATKVSSNPDLYKYSCICKATAPSNVNCILYYMECPIYPP
ncbi:uncharacterized protein [Montipora capricornis]|uniref:uncharacterized protein isoform X1 n=1 Tax=Montipora capricornis TaxID=246305 RepID=UPI0035F1F849